MANAQEAAKAQWEMRAELDFSRRAGMVAALNWGRLFLLSERDFWQQKCRFPTITKEPPHTAASLRPLARRPQERERD